MRSISFFVISFCSLFVTQTASHNSLWVYKQNSASQTNTEEVHKLTENRVIVPFIWKEIPDSVFNTALAKIRLYDSLISRSKKADSLIPEPLSFSSNGMTLLHSRKVLVDLGRCKYEVHVFLANDGPEIFEHDCYELFYIEGTGIVGAVHTANVKPSFDWEQYILDDVEDKNGKSTINRTRLKKIIEKVIPY